jgi:4-hydroxy-tetrahydrodipicolinate synthase
MTLTGLFVPMITPFDASGAVAWPALASLARTVLAGGATGLVALGTTAEPAMLTPTERDGVLDVLAEVCRDHDAPLIVGANDPAQLRPLAGGGGPDSLPPPASGRGPDQPVGAAGPGLSGMPGGPGRSGVPADAGGPGWPAAAAGRSAVVAALSVVPPFLRPGEEGVLAHFAALAEVAPVPLVVYHVPYRTAQPLSAAALRRLAALDGVTGVKLAAGGIDAEVVDLMGDVPPGFAVLGGDDTMISPLLALGADGGILASAHLETAAFADLIVSWQRGDPERARHLGHRLARLSAALFAEPNPTVIKGVLAELGRIPSAAVRLPLLPAAKESVESALALLHADHS